MNSLEEIKERQRKEYEELCRVVQYGSVEEKRRLAEKNHKGIGRVKWSPGKVRRKNDSRGNQ